MRKSLPLIVLLALGGCGGGGGGGAPVVQPPTPIIIDLPVDQGRSGLVMANGTATTPAAGDLAGNFEVRAIFTFPNGGVPPAATVQSAVLRVYQLSVTGTPYTKFTALNVDSVDVGATLDVADFNVAAFSSPGALAPFDATVEVKNLSVLAELVADRAAARTVSSFRISFTGAPTVDGVADRANFGVSTPGTETTLRVTYLP